MNTNKFDKFLAISLLISGFISNGIGTIVDFVKYDGVILSKINVIATFASWILIILLGIILIGTKKYLMYSYTISFITAFVSFPLILLSSVDAVFIYYLMIMAPTFGIISYRNYKISFFGLLAIFVYYIVFYFKSKYSINITNNFISENFAHISGGLIGSYLFTLIVSTILTQVSYRTNLILDKKANIDPLTGAKNRNILSAAELESSGILMIDIDYFKKINDEFGHINGDNSLKFLVRTIRSCIRKDDEIIRYGGEEFIVVLKNLSDIEVVKDIAETIRYNIVSKSRIDSKLKKYFTVSIGACIYDNELGLDENIKIVDSMLYAAKHNGRNQTFYNAIKD